MQRYTNSRDLISAEDLSECFKVILDRFGIAHREEEVSILVHHFVKDTGGRSMEAVEVLAMCRQLVDSQVWLQISKRIRSAVQNAYVTGTDVEQQLVEKDKDGDHFISANDFTAFLKGLSQHKKLSPTDIQSTLSHFSRNHGPGSGSQISAECVSLKEVMSFLGKDYVGNIMARIRKCVTGSQGEGKEGQGLGSGPRSPEEVLRVMRSHSNSSERADTITVPELEAALGAMGVYSELSHEQVSKSLRAISKGDGAGVTLVRVFTFLDIPAPEGLTAASSSSKKDKDKDKDSPLDAEELLRVLLEQVREKHLHLRDVYDIYV
jgi:hypothetical protein